MPVMVLYVSTQVLHFICQVVKLGCEGGFGLRYNQLLCTLRCHRHIAICLLRSYVILQEIKLIPFIPLRLTSNKATLASNLAFDF